MDRAGSLLSQRLLDVLEQLLRLPVGDMKATLSHVSDVIARASGADKVDAFLYDAARDSLVAVGSSTQPLSMLQREYGLDVLPVSNGGRTVRVFVDGETLLHGHIDQDPDELPRSEEHTSELQSHVNLVCRLLLEKKKTPTLAT